MSSTRFGCVDKFVQNRQEKALYRFDKGILLENTISDPTDSVARKKKKAAVKTLGQQLGFGGTDKGEESLPPSVRGSPVKKQ